MGVIFVGVVWGLWHMPLDFFYTADPSMGLISVFGHQITCITLGIFFCLCLYEDRKYLGSDDPAFPE